MNNYQVQYYSHDRRDDLVRQAQANRAIQTGKSSKQKSLSQQRKLSNFLIMIWQLMLP